MGIAVVIDPQRDIDRVLDLPGNAGCRSPMCWRHTSTTTTCVFTGGSMLHGTTGRTDLLGPEHTEELSHAQFHSVRRLAAELPDAAQVYPSHGFGSFYSATPAGGDASTIADQRRTNPALTHDEQSYVDELLAGLGDHPAYYAHVGVVNAQGPARSICPCPNRWTLANSAVISKPATGWWICAAARPSPPVTSRSGCTVRPDTARRSPPR